MAKGYDIIGDIHGHADALKQMLDKLGYHSENGVYAHPERQVIFVGDLIDRGPKIRETLDIAKGMVDAGNALIVMGNHEFNAIAYQTKGPNGDFLRVHDEVNVGQHKETLAEFADASVLWQGYLEWFYQLPMFLDLGELRVVHAHWEPGYIDWVIRHHGGKLTPALLVEGHAEGMPGYAAVETILKGSEYELPEELSFKDKSGHLRSAARIKWWHRSEGLHPSVYLFNVEPDVKQELENPLTPGYPADAPPVFFGHYWLTDARPALQRHNVACLDYSVAKKGFLCAYRWSGEQVLMETNLVRV